MTILTETKLGRSSVARKERGASAVEYALIIALIAVGVFIAGTALPGALTTFFDYVASVLPSGA